MQMCIRDRDGLAAGADRFQQDVHDLVQLLPVYPGILGEGVILDVLSNQVPVALIGRFLSASCPFRRRCRCLALVQRQGVWGKMWIRDRTIIFVR